MPQALRLRLRPEAIGPRVYLRDDDRRGVHHEECTAAAADEATCEAAGACTFTAGVAGATDGACVTATVAACAAAVADQATCEAAGTCTFNTTTAGTLEAWEYACTSVDECYIQKRAAGKAAFELHHGVRVVDDFELADLTLEHYQSHAAIKAKMAV